MSSYHPWFQFGCVRTWSKAQQWLTCQPCFFVMTSATHPPLTSITIPHFYNICFILCAHHPQTFKNPDLYIPQRKWKPSPLFPLLPSLVPLLLQFFALMISITGLLLWFLWLFSLFSVSLYVSVFMLVLTVSFCHCLYGLIHGDGLLVSITKASASGTWRKRKLKGFA